MLLIPTLLFCLDVPQEGFASVADGNLPELIPVRVADRGPLGREVRYTELQEVANAPDRRADWEGKTVTLKGRLIVSEKGELSLVRMVIPCCVHHYFVVQIPVVIEPTGAPLQNLAGVFPKRSQVSWVQVTGQIQFRIRRTDRDAPPVLVLVVRRNDKRPLQSLITELPANEERPVYEFAESP